MACPRQHQSLHRHGSATTTLPLWRKPTLPKAAKAVGGLALLIALGGACGCDSKSSSDANPVTQMQTPTGTATALPPRPIPATSLPFADGELNVTGAFPGPGEERVALVSPISVQFDDPLLPGQDLARAIRVSAGVAEISGSISQSAPDTLIFRPTDMWQANTHYAIEINPSLMSADGLQVNAALRWEFLTIADVYTTSQSIIDWCMSDLDVEMLAAVNQARTVSRSCGTVFYAATDKLSWNCLLQEAAITHSQDMANHDFFAHVGSDGSEVLQRVLRTGYTPSMVGENLAIAYTTVATVMVGLLESPLHCGTLMAPGFTEFGFGHTFNANLRQYWTQNFAQPAAW
jgi:uncharacterized protein YkwD